MSEYIFYCVARIPCGKGGGEFVELYCVKSYNLIESLSWSNWCFSSILNSLVRRLIFPFDHHVRFLPPLEFDDGRSRFVCMLNIPMHYFSVWSNMHARPNESAYFLLCEQSEELWATSFRSPCEIRVTYTQHMESLTNAWIWPYLASAARHSRYRETCVFWWPFQLISQRRAVERFFFYRAS
jgi:hypothetical protein